MALRLHFMKHKINYKDCRGQWNVNISFEDEKVVVTHQKWEETVPRKFEVGVIAIDGIIDSLCSFVGTLGYI